MCCAHAHLLDYFRKDDLSISNCDSRRHSMALSMTHTTASSNNAEARSIVAESSDSSYALRVNDLLLFVREAMFPFLSERRDVASARAVLVRNRPFLCHGGIARGCPSPQTRRPLRVQTGRHVSERRVASVLVRRETALRPITRKRTAAPVAARRITAAGKASQAIVRMWRAFVTCRRQKRQS